MLHSPEPSTGKCPVVHSAAPTTGGGGKCPVAGGSSATGLLNPLNRMPATPAQHRGEDQDGELSTARVQSTIPKADGDTWVYPSPLTLHRGGVGAKAVTYRTPSAQVFPEPTTWSLGGWRAGVAMRALRAGRPWGGHRAQPQRANIYTYDNWRAGSPPISQERRCNTLDPCERHG